MKGISLVEVLLAMAVSSIVGLFLFAILVNNTGVFYNQSSKVEQGLKINDSLSTIRTAVKSSNAIAQEYPPGSPTYTSGSSQLVLRFSSLDSSGSVIQNTYDYAVFFVENQKLLYKVFPNASSTRPPSDQLLALNVDSIAFKYYDTLGQEVIPSTAAKVLVSVTLKTKAGNSFQTQTATTEAYLRNN